MTYPQLDGITIAITTLGCALFIFGMILLSVLRHLNQIDDELDRIETELDQKTNMRTWVAGEPITADQIETCRPVEVDGEIIRVHGVGEMTEEDRSHLAEIVRAAKTAMEREQNDDHTA